MMNNNNASKLPKCIHECVCDICDIDPIDCGYYKPDKVGYIVKMKDGAIYNVWKYTCCGLEYVESKCDNWATEIPQNYCPNCGTRIVD